MQPQATTIPLGFCQCGCGERTRIATKTRTDWGHVRGQPLQFIHGHVARDRVRYRQYAIFGKIDPVTGCWVWQGPLRKGYANVFHQGKRVPVHRLMYEAYIGPIPEGYPIDHLCRNRACINPDHLEPVTTATNIQRGLKAKLTWADVATIRQLGLSMSQRKLAKLYGVSHNAIGSVLHGRSWKE